MHGSADIAKANSGNCLLTKRAVTAVCPRFTNAGNATTNSRSCSLKMYTQLKQDSETVLDYCWSSVYEADPTMNQHCLNGQAPPFTCILSGSPCNRCETLRDNSLGEILTGSLIIR